MAFKRGEFVRGSDKNKSGHSGKKFGPFSEEHRRKISLSLIGNKHSLGKVPWNKGIHISEETRKKMSVANKGHYHSEETKRKIGNANRGMKRSEETKEKMRLFRREYWKSHPMEAENNRKRLLGNKYGVGWKHTYAAKKRMSVAKLGVKNPFWNGGISKLPYAGCWSDTLKESIRQRDNFTCKICGCVYGGFGTSFHVHHIDYDPENCNPNNLVTLCGRCHLLTTVGNRKRWMYYFGGV